MKIDDKTGLVLEGGGMRGVFTCGVLDYLMDNEIWFSYGVGVSAGACNGLSYMSRQRGRAKFSNIDLLDKYHYIGINICGANIASLTKNCFTSISLKKSCHTIMKRMQRIRHVSKW